MPSFPQSKIVRVAVVLLKISLVLSMDRQTDGQSLAYYIHNLGWVFVNK